MSINLRIFFSNTRNLLDLLLRSSFSRGLATLHCESASECTKVIKTVRDSWHDLSSIGMQTLSISHRVGFDIEVARRLESESQRLPDKIYYLKHS